MTYVISRKLPKTQRNGGSMSTVKTRKTKLKMGQSLSKFPELVRTESQPEPKTFVNKYTTFTTHHTCLLWIQSYFEVSSLKAKSYDPLLRNPNTPFIQIPPLSWVKSLQAQPVLGLIVLSTEQPPVALLCISGFGILPPTQEHRRQSDTRNEKKWD